MHSNDFRTAVVIGLACGAVATFATIAILVNDLDARIPDAINRLRLSPADRADYDRILREQKARREFDVHAREQVQIQIRAKFRPELLSGPIARELSELSVSELISEVRYAKNRKCAEMVAVDPGYPVERDARVWAPQLEALRSEFESRDPDELSFLDRARFYHAYNYVSSHTDEWPTARDAFAQNVDVPASVAPWQSRTFPPYPDFSGPADEAQALIIPETLGDSAEQQ
ncbi:hypothetical protein AB0L82_26160 [Nocardia sp. NPDC052001]|uniref:hypothetical protein n=1 Tax=Nocardia sp. NPDC052001 TaxID=3154853 RepID=UPI003437E15F